MDINRVLYEFGVRDDTLSDDDIASLDRNGFVRIENALTPEQVEIQRRRVDELIELEGEAAGLEVHKEEGADRLGDLVNKDGVSTSVSRIPSCSRPFVISSAAISEWAPSTRATSIRGTAIRRSTRTPERRDGPDITST